MWIIIFDNLPSFSIFFILCCVLHTGNTVCDEPRVGSLWFGISLVWACKLVEETRVEIWNLNGGSNWAVRNGMYSIVPRGREILALLHLPHQSSPTRTQLSPAASSSSANYAHAHALTRNRKWTPTEGAKKKRECIFPHYYLNQKQNY